jgi:hypothetical protein
VLLVSAGIIRARRTPARQVNWAVRRPEGEQTMRDNNYLGWFSFNALSFAVILSVLSIFDPLGVLANHRGAQLVAAALSFVAAVFGFGAFKTGSGRVGGVGGTALLLVLGLWLSWTTLA